MWRNTGGKSEGGDVCGVCTDVSGCSVRTRLLMCNSLSLSSLQSDWLGTNQERRDHHTHSGRRLRLANAWPSHSSLLFCFFYFLFLFVPHTEEGREVNTDISAV